jgi:hypothetical protein
MSGLKLRLHNIITTTFLFRQKFGTAIISKPDPFW